MKLKTTIVTLSFLAACFIAISGTMNQSGPPASHTNAPGESNCTACHSGSIITSGTNWNNVRLKGDFTGGGYIPDSVYTIEITHKQTGISKFGFQVTALVKSSNAPAGNITVSSNRVQRLTNSVSGQTRNYATHTQTGTATVGTDSTRWFFTWTAPSSNVGDVIFYVVINATNNNGNETGDQIFAKTFDITPSTLLPVATAYTQDSVTCTGYEVSFQGSGTNNTTSYSWQFTGGQPSSSSAQNPTVKFTSPGSPQYAILRVRNDKGQSLPDTFNVTVFPSPNASIIGGSSATICEGDSILLSATNVSGTTYNWIPGNKTGREIWVKDPGEHRVIVTRTTTGCSAVSNPFTLFVDPIPQLQSFVTASGKDTFCDMIQDTLKVSYNQADSFFWVVDGQLTKTIVPQLSVSSASTINASVQAKNSNGCLSVVSNMTLHAVKPINPLNLMGTSTSTSTVTLDWNTTPGALGYQVSLDTGKTYSGATINTTFDITGLEPNTQYRFYVRTLQNAPCISSDTSIEVTTLPCSNISFNIVSDSAICFLDFVTVTVHGLAGQNYGVSFDNGLNYSRDTIFSTQPFADGIVIVKIIDSAELACPPITRNIAYKVVNPVNDTITRPDIATLCSNESYVYEVVDGYNSVEYYLNGNLVAATSDNSFEFSALSSTDSVYAIGELGPCRVMFQVVKFNVLPAPAAGFTFQRNHKTYLYTANETNGNTYEWNFGDGNTSGVQNPSHTYLDMNKTVDVSLKVTNSNDCESTDTQSIVLPDVASLRVLKQLGIEVYPNPFTDFVEISNANSTKYDFEIFNSVGQKVISGSTNDKQNIIETGVLATGVYVLKIKSAGSHATLTLVKH